MNFDDCAVPGSLAFTGPASPLLLGMLALAVLGIGLALLRVRRARGMLLALALCVGGGIVAAAPPTPAAAAGTLVCTASISGQAWADANTDGIRQDAEAPLSGLSVELTDADGAGLATTTSDSQGQYSFTSLPAGQYRVSFPTNPDGLELTVAAQGAADRDSDAAADGRTELLSLAEGEAITAVDVGYAAALGSIGDRIWIDANSDGLQNDTDGLAGVTVSLYLNGNLLTTTVSDAAGDYLFTDLAAGSYSVRFPTEFNGRFLTQHDQGSDDAADSDPNYELGATPDYVLAAGQELLTVDAGYLPLPTGSIGGLVWADLDGDGLQGDDQWLAGVEVALLDPDNLVLRTTVTDANGSYLFDDLEAGSYAVRFPTTFDGYTQTLFDQGSDDDADSDAGEGGDTLPITLAAGVDLGNYDAGYLPPASLGGVLWFDVNSNGIRDESDPLPTMTVNLLDRDNNVIDSMVTDNSGGYRFAGLTPGTYSVEFPSGFEGWRLTLENQGSDDALDSDATLTNARAGSFALSAGDSLTGIDAGYRPIINRVSGKLWLSLDANFTQETGELPLAGVLVELIDVTNQRSYDFTFTDADGSFSFSGMPDGDYQVVVPPSLEDPPGGVGIWTPQPGGLYSAGLGGTATISLTSGELFDEANIPYRTIP